MADLQYTCPQCAAPITYDIRQRKMKCGYCSSTFSVEEVENYTRKLQLSVLEEEAQEYSQGDEQDTAQPPVSSPLPMGMDPSALPEGASQDEDDEASDEGMGDVPDPSEFDAVGSHEWQINEGTTLSAAEQAQLTLLECDSCGAHIEEASEVISTRCAYCNNTLVAVSRMEQTRVPDWIIPFKVDREAMIVAFQKASEKLPLIPHEFRDAAVIREASGMYVPFWLYDGTAAGEVTFDATIIRGSGKNRKEDKYRLETAGSLDFQGITVCASKHLARERAEAAEPFDINSLVPFQTAYLAGYSATSFTIPAKEAHPIGEGRAIKTLEHYLSTRRRYSKVEVADSRVGFSKGRVSYAMLPIWLLNIEFDGKLHQFTINGQSGEVVGVFPIAKKRLWWVRLKGFLAGAVAGGALWVANLIHHAQAG